MTEIKYIAAGFVNDAERLLEDFQKENSMEFSVFAEKWKKHNFSLIYAFRPNIRELCEFTQEIFQLSLNFLKSTSLLKQVGGIFLLYALYRNQILSPPLRIRITSEQFETIMTLLDKSIALNNKCLHFVLTYLINNSFDCVASPKLMGPNFKKNEPNIDNEFNLKIQVSDMKHELTEISESRVLHEIDHQFNEYKKTALSINEPGICISSEHHSFKDSADSIDILLDKNDPSNSEIFTSSKNSAIGSHRASIKAAAFSKSVSHHLSHDDNNATTSCLSDDIESSVKVLSKPLVPISGKIQKRCVRRGRRKNGRPKKWVSEDSMSEEELQLNPDVSLQEKGICQRKPRGPQFSKARHYYADDSLEEDLNIPSTSEYLSQIKCLFSSGSEDNL